MSTEQDKSKLELFFTWLWLAFLLSTCLLVYPAIITAIGDRQQCDQLYDAAAQSLEQVPPEDLLERPAILYRDCCNLLAKNSASCELAASMNLLNPIDWGSVLYYELVKLKPTALVLIMVTLSGVMGSTIHLCRRFFGFRDPNAVDRVYTLRWFLLRPFSGAITAVALFVLVMSGQMAFSQTGGEMLSPYLVSFVALIGGFLSVQAQDRLKTAGENLLKGGTLGGAHFATPLFQEKMAEMAAKGITPERLCARQSFSVGQVESWSSGQQPVPEKYQAIFAAWMDESVEQLFDRENKQGNIDKQK